jgi:hypothetical protein
MEKAGMKNGNNKYSSEHIREQQHNKPSEITSQQMFDEKIIPK